MNSNPTVCCYIPRWGPRIEYRYTHKHLNTLIFFTALLQRYKMRCINNPMLPFQPYPIIFLPSPLVNPENEVTLWVTTRQEEKARDMVAFATAGIY